MLKKIRRSLTRVTTHIISKTIKKKRRPPTPTTTTPSPPPPPSHTSVTMPHHHHHHQTPFIFPKTQSTVLPDPTAFFSPNLLSSPLPTNSFFQNFTLKNGDQPEYIHPYLIKSASSSISLSYPTRVSTPGFIYQSFTPDLTISFTPSPSPSPPHRVAAFDGLSVTLDLSNSLRCFLVRGSPYLTLSSSSSSSSTLSISTIHSFVSLSSNATLTKHTLSLSNGQTFLCYSSSPIQYTKSNDSLSISASGFSGIARFAYLPDPSFESVLDRFSACYPISGEASFTRPFCLEYTWEKKGWGDLLLLAHPLHLRLLSPHCLAVVLPDFKYNSIDGELVGVVGDSWVLNTDPIPLTWHSIKGVGEENYPEIASALAKDVEGLSKAQIATTSSYYYGKAVSRAARFALIAEEVCASNLVPAVGKFLKDSITSWLDGSFAGNGFLYDSKWGGIVTKQGSVDSGADFGFGIYNDHHYHLGYFLYAIAVLAKIDPAWGRKYRPQAYSMVADIMSLSERPGAEYTRLRCFDVWKLHSWAGGLTEFADGRNQESTSEAVNGYYSTALIGLSYGDTHLASLGSTLAAFEIRAAETWWHVREGDRMYEEEFTRDNRVVGVLWANKRDSGLWFAPPDWKECRLGIQVLPLLPITELLFRDVGFVKELVKWATPSLAREGAGESWKGFVYALEGVYDKGSALEKTKALNGFDDGNSLSNLLWWLHSRGEEEGGIVGWFHHYCR